MNSVFHFRLSLMMMVKMMVMVMVMVRMTMVVILKMSNIPQELLDMFEAISIYVL